MWTNLGHIKEIKGDLLASDVRIRAHQVNCKGAMGAGIALQVKKQYPEAYAQYKELCDQFGSSLLGHTQFVVCHDGTIIANMFAQDGFGGTGPKTDMAALDECIAQVAVFSCRVNASVGFPKFVGCGLAGGNWDEVYALIGSYFDNESLGCTIVEFDQGGDKEPEPEKKPAADRAKVTIYTDGSCLGNPGPGGWAVILMASNGKRDVQKELFGGAPQTTNNQMELTGVIRALEALTKPCVGKLYTDSSYVVNSINKGWMEGWKAKGWTKKGGLANVELWKQVDKLLQIHDIEFIWVKGHAENEFNNRCDVLARVEAARQSELGLMELVKEGQ